MELLAQQLTAGIATGAIYACVALALVMIYQAIGHINFAQGEMAMFSTFLAWQFMQWGAPYWVAFAAAVVVSFAGGVLIDRTIFRPIRSAQMLSQIVMFVGLMAMLNSVAGFIWDFTSKPFPTPFGSDPLFGSGLISTHQTAMILITFGLLMLLFCFFRYGRDGEFFQVRGRWSRSVPVSERAAVLDLANDWNAEKIWPKVYVRAEDDELGVYCEHSVDYEHGVSDQQIDLHIAAGLSTALQFFASLDEAYPQAVEAFRERLAAEGPDA